MRFSIVTPSFNQGRFIETTIKSVLNQTHEDVEYIIIDGGSSDNTGEIVNKYIPQINKYISEPDRGQTDAINKGFGYAEGDIYAYLNSDDCYFEDTLKKVDAIFSENPDVDVVYGDCVFTDHNGQFVRYFSEIWDYSQNRLLNNVNFIMQPSTFWRRKAFEKYGPFDTRLHYGFDWAYWCELAKNNCRFYRAREVLSANRVYEETKTSSGGKERLAELRSINKKYKTTLLDNAYYTFALSEYTKKADKSIMEYIKQAIYLVLSYQNIIFHMIHVNEKVVNGICPHSTCLLQHVRLRLPFQNDYSKINISLLTPGFTEQTVEVDIGGGVKEKYRFENEELNIEIDAAHLRGDIDIKMEFGFLYSRPQSLIQRARMHYQSRKISAELLAFTVK